MKKKIIGFFLMAFVAITVNASKMARSHAVLFKERDKATRAPVPMPIDATIEDNNCIMIRFLEPESQTVTLQIRDSNGNIVYQDMKISDEGEVYNINLNGFKKGQYELFYMNDHFKISGEFYIE